MPRNFVQTILMGQDERVYIETRNASGNLVSANNVKLSLYDPEGTKILDQVSANEESTGIYYYNISISTASSNKEGLYRAFWTGSIGGVNLSQDKAKNILIRRHPHLYGLANDLVDNVRRLCGDNNPGNYRINEIDILWYIQDGVRLIQSTYNLGYTVEVSYSSITFNKTLTELAKYLFIQGAVLSILKHLRNKNLWGVGSLDVGDLRVNMTNINRERALACKDLEEKLERTINGLKRGSITGASIDTYYTGESTIADLVGV